MRQELIDYLLGELPPEQAEAMQARLASDPALTREYAEIASLFSLVRRGEEIEPPAECRSAVLAAAERALAPTLLQRIAQVPGLLGFRFRRSFAFRVATVSLAAHLVVMAVLFFTLEGRSAAHLTPPDLEVVAADLEAQRPQRGFVARLELRRIDPAPVLRQVGVDGQAEAIRSGLETLLDRQAADGSFGDVEETAYATLALLAEGDCSVQATVRGRAIRAAVGHLLEQARRDAVHGAVLAALVEDYSLSYDRLPDPDRLVYCEAIRSVMGSLRATDDSAREGFALARLAGFAVPSGIDLGNAGSLLGGDTAALLRAPARRLAATVVLAKGQTRPPERAAVREWAAPLFEAAKAEIEAGRVTALGVLTLQSPYRL